MIKLFIDGVDHTINTDLETVSTIIGLNTSTESFNLETSGLTLNLRGDAAKLMKDLYINCQYPPVVTPVRLTTNYGDFNFSLLPGNVTWCNDCTASILLTGGNNEELCFNRLNNTNVLNDGFWNYVIDQKKFRITVTSKDISAFNAVGIRVLQFVHIFANIFLPGPVKARSNFALYGTGRWHPAIKVTDILQYYANQCGKVFKSTILQNDPFNRLYILPAIADPGKWYHDFNLELKNTDRYAIEYTLVEFLDILKDLFYADWRINENEIILYPSERILEDAVNLGEINPIENICITPIDNNCAKLSLNYALDYVDDAGDSERDLYLHVEDYQINNRALSEICKIDIPASIAVNTSGKSRNDFVRSERSPGNENLIDLWDFLHKELLLSNHRSALPKFLINSIEAENTNTRFGNFLIQDQIDYDGFKLPNPQLSFNREVPGNLYDRFHYKRNPANGYQHCLEIESLDICFDGEILSNMRAAFAAGKTVYFTSEFGNMYFTSAEVFFGVGQRIKLNNIKIYDI